MLVLSRKATEKIFLGRDIEITVLGVHGNRVSIGIEAPKSLAVWRSEVLSGKESTDVEEEPEEEPTA